MIGTTSTTAKLLVDLRRAHVTLSVTSGRLSYVAPPGVMTPELLATLRSRKPELLAVLRSDYLHAAAAVVLRVRDLQRRSEVIHMFYERAAICEYDGSLSRAEAERLAYAELTKELLDE